MCSISPTIVMRTRHRAARRLPRSLVVVAISAAVVSACNRPAQLTQLVEARRVASALHVQFTYAADAANRAVMADTDDASTAAANEARQARQAVERHVETLRPMLASLGFNDDLKHLDGFTSRFDEYRKLDDEILSLAVQNTNLKAQRLSFGPAQEAAVAFRSSVDAAVRSSTAKDRCDALTIAARASTALLEMQVMQAPHIAEPDDAVMTRLEGQMTAAAAVAGKSVDELGRTLPPAARPQLDAARAALSRFMAIHGEIITLSRRNTNVRSLALSLGRKRVLTAACEELLQTFETALAGHAFNATR